MKLIYVVIDGMGDLPISELGDRTPLGAADTPNMDRLADRAIMGLMYTLGKGMAPESDVAVVSILGYDPFKYDERRGISEAVGAGLIVKDGDLALRCNFATKGSGNIILDRRVGRNLSTEEATELARAISEQLALESYPATFEFKNTVGHRAVLVIRSKGKRLSGEISNTDPAYTRIHGAGVAEPKPKMIVRKCKPLQETEEAQISARLVNEFTEKSTVILRGCKINKTRASEGKLEANLVLSRDAGSALPGFFPINEKYNVRFVCLADMPAERGIAKLCGMNAVDLPPPSGHIESDCKLRVEKLKEVLPSYDCFYIHIKGPDEPSHDGNFRLKTSMIASIDKHFFGPILNDVGPEQFVICITADHSTPCKLRAHTDDPVPLLIWGDGIEGDGLSKFSEEECGKGSLGTIDQGSKLMPQLMVLLKKRQVN